MNDGEFLGGFVTGCAFMLVVSCCISMYMDTSWEYVEKRYKQGVSLCEQLDSTPQSIDDYNVTCENGKTINWRD